MAEFKAFENLREFFRIPYRSPEVPIFEFDRTKYNVVDISEGGIKFALKKGMFFAEKDPIVGMLIFPSKRGMVQIKGTIIRVTTRDVAIQLDENARIPFAKVMEEQRLLIQRGKL